MKKVVHCKNAKFDIYIGRPSKWGNVYSHKANTKAQFRTASRSEAIEKYREWILNGSGKYLLDDLHELKGKVLGCWCAPLPCHGDVLIDLINELNI